jgi:serine/threonine protein kinase
MLTVKYDDKIVLGTADYVAPEQVANSHAVDIRADIYALGASLYFLLSGHPPFPNGTVSQKLLWHRSKDPTPIRSIRPEVPAGLAAVLARMMAKDPAARYQTPGEVALELDQFFPAEVPLPALEEMPTLSPAALEGMPVEEEVAEEDLVLQPVGAGSGVSSRSHSMREINKARSAGEKAEASRGPVRGPNPFPTSVSTGSPSGVVRDLRKPTTPTSNPFGPSASTPSPWAAYSDTPSAMAEKTTRESDPVHLRTPSPFVVGHVTPNRSSRMSLKVVIGVIVTCVLVAGAIVFWTFAK